MPPSSDNNVDIDEQLTMIDCSSGRLPAFVTGPSDSKSYPGLIVVHEIFGLNDHIKDIARRFAKQSLRVFAPDLFANAPGLPADRNDLNAMRQVWQATADQQFTDDLKSVLTFAQKCSNVQADKIGAIGYCMGGAMAFMLACQAPELAFSIDYYGRILYPETSDKKPKHPIDYAGALKCPVLAIFAGQDPLIPKKDIELLDKKLKELGKELQVKIYEDASHAFFNDRRESYRPKEAADAWNLTLDFINRQCLDKKTKPVY